MFQDDYVAIGASGGKDSTVLAYIMKTLNDRYDYGLKLVLLSIDEGITGLHLTRWLWSVSNKTTLFLNTGYRDDSLETVKRNRDQYGIPLKVLSYEDLYGWTMDKIVAQVGWSWYIKHWNGKVASQVGLKNNCTFCGVFRRQALDRGAMQVGIPQKTYQFQWVDGTKSTMDVKFCPTMFLLGTTWAPYFTMC